MTDAANVYTAQKAADKPPASASANGSPDELPGQLASAQQIAAVQSEANNYATTKSVTQVIFTTSAIASNVTLWNQLDRKAAHFGALNALIWISVAINIFVILLATYLSFQRPKTEPAKKSPAVKPSPGKTSPQATKAMGRAPQTPAGEATKPSPDQKPNPLAMVAGKLGPDEEPDAVDGSPNHQKGMQRFRDLHVHDLAEKGGCCWESGGTQQRRHSAAATHTPYYGDAVELCGVKLYSRSNAHPSWACCDVGCCALFRVSGTGKGLGMLSVNASKKRKRHFMDARNNLLNEVIGILAVLIVVINVVISSIAAGTK